MPDEDPFEEHLRAFYKKERDAAGEEHAPSEDEWELIQRKRRKENEAKSPREEERFSLWSFPRFAYALGTVGAIILIATLILRQRGIELAGLPPSEIVRGDEPSLPESLKLNSKGFVTLTGEDGRLEGTLNLTNSSQGLFFFETTLSGRDAVGALHFSGTLILTNSAASPSGLTKENVSGALLHGDISRPGVTTNTTARRYILR